MPNYKVNLFFKLGSAGWSETYYTTKNTPQAASEIADLLRTKRASILAQPAQIIAARISDDAIVKDSVLDATALTGQFNKTATADTPWQALLCRLAATSLYWRPLYLRGIPDSAHNPEDALSTTDSIAWYTKVDTYLGWLKAQAFQIKSQSKGGDAPIRNVRIWNRDSATKTLVLTDVPHGFAVGQTVQFYNIRGLPSPPGKRIVTDVVDAFSVKFDYPTSIDYVYPGRGTVKKVVYTYQDIDTTNRERITHRIVGRPFDLQRGARRRKARV